MARRHWPPRVSLTQDSKTTSGFDRWFELTKRRSTIGREIRGGVVTFVTMAYIVVLGPLILGTAKDSTGSFIGVTAPSFAGSQSSGTIGGHLGGGFDVHLGRHWTIVSHWMDSLLARGVRFDATGFSCYQQAAEGDWANTFARFGQRYPDHGF